MASIVGKALRGLGRALRAHRIKHGKRGKTISSVKPHSGKIPWYVGAGKTPEARKGIVRTHFSLKRSDKIDKAVKDIKGVKPFSGKIPSYVSGTPERRAGQIKTHFHVKRIDKVSKAEKQIKEGKKTLKDMQATKQAEEFKDYKGKGTGKYHAR